MDALKIVLVLLGLVTVITSMKVPKLMEETAPFPCNGTRDDRCPMWPDPAHPVLLPVEKCDQFLLCDNCQVVHLFDCAPGGLVFEESVGQCVWPWESSRPECRDPPEPDTTTSTEPSPDPEPVTVDPSLEPKINCSLIPGDRDDRCPKWVDLTKPPVLLAVEECDQFLQCDNCKIVHLQHCAPGGLVFEESVSQCVWPWESSRPECTNISVPDLASRPKRSPESKTLLKTLDPSTEPKINCSLIPGDRDDRCPKWVDLTKPPVLLAVEECDQFLQCDNCKIVHLQHCAAEGLVFEEAVSQCVWPWESSRPECRNISVPDLASRPK